MNPVNLNQETRKQLREIIQTEADTLARRAKLILAYADGMQTIDAAKSAGISGGRARYWKREFNRIGMGIFAAKDTLVEKASDHAGLTEGVVLEKEHLGNARLEEEALIPNKAEKKEKSKTRKEKKYAVPALPFPEPLKAPGILPDDTLAEAGRKIFLVQFAVMLKNETGTRLGEDIEALHDMRVATRRMRAAFDVFNDAFRKKTIKSHLSGLRQTGRLLGSVRDLDVFMEKANKYLDSLVIDARQGLDPLLSMWQDQLIEARENLITYLDSKAYQEFLLDFNYFVQTPGIGVKAMGEVIPTPHKVCEIVPCIIYSRLAAVRAYDAIIQNATIPQLHILRIEFKKLRYALEFFIEVLGPEAREVIGLIKKMQDHLGDLHDADVACQILNNYLEKWDSGQIGVQLTERQNPEPLVNYLAFQHAERHRLMVTFPEVWALFEQPEIMRKVALAVAAL